MIKQNRYKHKTWFIVLMACTIVLLIISMLILDYYNLLPKRYYTARDFKIDTVYSKIDYNNNGVDDYTDFVCGARKDAENHPAYDGKYWAEGYPPENIGVCTDVVWRSFRYAGYSLRDMIDKDIKARSEAYSLAQKPDSNIDFRRVGNLHAFFAEYAIELTIDGTKIDQWQPGDIVVFDQDKHIGILSDKRNRDGKPYVIHNGGQPNREEDYLKNHDVTAHYRFDADKVNHDILVGWNDKNTQ